MNRRELLKTGVRATALASLLRATVEHGREADTTATIAALDAAGKRLAECHMHHYAAAADFRRGTLVGGAEGREIVQTASGWMASQNMMNAARMADLLAPGPWTERRAT